MMMRYPVSAGPLSEGVLDDMFGIIRKVRCKIQLVQNYWSIVYNCAGYSHD